MVAVEMIVAVERVEAILGDNNPLNPAIFVEDVMNPLGMVAAPFATGIGRVSHQGMITPAKVANRLEHAISGAMAERIAVIPSHHLDNLLEPVAANSPLNLIEPRRGTSRHVSLSECPRGDESAPAGREAVGLRLRTLEQG